MLEKQIANREKDSRKIEFQEPRNGILQGNELNMRDSERVM